MDEAISDSVIVRTFEDHTEVQFGGRTLEVERRDALTRENVCPMEFVSVGLGSCISLTISAVAREKHITPEKIEVQVNRKTSVGEKWQSTFEIKVNLGAGLTERERILLFNAARSCEVHKMLKGEKTFNFQLEAL